MSLLRTIGVATLGRTTATRFFSAAAAASERHVGEVKWFNLNKGYGFIQQEGHAQDVFVHHSGISACNFPRKGLQDGESVEFSTETTEEGKLRAVDVTGPDGSPVLGGSEFFDQHGGRDTFTF